MPGGAQATAEALSQECVRLEPTRATGKEEPGEHLYTIEVAGLPLESNRSVSFCVSKHDMSAAVLAAEAVLAVEVVGALQLTAAILNSRNGIPGAFETLGAFGA